ncbi:MAG: HRDC domain-containing protein [Planctomycetota bacterium]|nr:HRDC domain-containing protein [Planctomycetota bacterium]
MTSDHSESNSNRLIIQQHEFDDLCDHIVERGVVAFDTEFISEHTFHPQLCLLQFATSDRIAAVDPFAVTDLRRWWEIMADDTTTIVVHGGQAEIRFCYVHAQLEAQRLFDVQLAEGLIGTSYPLGYATLINRVLGKRVQSGQTRADWKYRPLSSKQLDYALDDVEFLLAVWDQQTQTLQRLNRTEWCEVECRRLIVQNGAEFDRPPWERVSGIHRLDRRALATAMELSKWRDSEARRRDIPLRRILRDDLLIDLAQRQPASVHEVLGNRDMKRPQFRECAAAILAAVEHALAIPEKELPRTIRNRKDNSVSEEQVLTKLLSLALADRCAKLNVAPPLVGTSADIRDLIRWFLSGKSNRALPKLREGWRSEVCGDLLTDLLDGRISLRVVDPKSDNPLRFDAADS